MYLSDAAAVAAVCASHDVFVWYEHTLDDLVGALHGEALKDLCGAVTDCLMARFRARVEVGHGVQSSVRTTRKEPSSIF